MVFCRYQSSSFSPTWLKHSYVADEPLRLACELFRPAFKLIIHQLLISSSTVYSAPDNISVLRSRGLSKVNYYFRVTFFLFHHHYAQLSEKKTRERRFVIYKLTGTKTGVKIRLTVALITQRINKCIMPKTRREIRGRDLCCQYKDPLSGKLCKSTYGLQIDHQQPRWDHGDNSFSNITTLCMQHNQHKYKKETNIRSL